MRVAWLVVVVAACNRSPSKPAVSPSFHDSLQALCDVPDHVPAKDKPYMQRLADVSKWADEHVTDAEVRALGSVDKDINREQLVAATKRAGIEHCKLLDNGMALQSFADAMRDVCAAPMADRDKVPAYIQSHLLNPEVVRTMGKLGMLAPADQLKVLQDAVAKAGLTSCAVLDFLKAHGSGG